MAASAQCGQTRAQAARHMPQAVRGQGVRQLLPFADSVKAPQSALLPVILGQPHAPSDFTAGLAASAPSAGGADRG